ncbi:dihydrofolate reductase family protein [Catenulispora sp. NF23]|uniref:dihydrofolate reductase family protein n=1 Tax=Catenulispora pinistramenti TaxID=2705254 RepID=UPI001BA6CCC4|nr:dihydrofolate reductase family protein [Catenulispora pinistramenti]MBS2532854.1 dihydrofolate reductase family protein [Catenulispora pinistramenti]
MSTVTANMSMSLDGFVNHPTDGVDTLFRWYSRGEVVTGTDGDHDWEFKTDASEAQDLQGAKDSIGAIVYGRRSFDAAEGWHGTHPLGVPVVVLTHSAPRDWEYAGRSVHFVTEGGIAAAIARGRELGGGRTVVIGSADLTQQALNEGLLDELTVDLVAAMLGAGTRFFDNLKGAPYELEQTSVRPGDGVTHLAYRVVKP